MKVYNLSCEHQHVFEGWFSSEDDFTGQAQSGCIECPVCESRAIRKLPAAPRLNLSGGALPERTEMAQLQAQFMKLVSEVIAKTEDVGARFAEEARRIHYDEAPERAIRGTASFQECAELIEEGIDIMPVPIPASKQSLQ